MDNDSYLFKIIKIIFHLYRLLYLPAEIETIKKYIPVAIENSRLFYNDSIIRYNMRKKYKNNLGKIESMHKAAVTIIAKNETFKIDMLQDRALEEDKERNKRIKTSTKKNFIFLNINIAI